MGWQIFICTCNQYTKLGNQRTALIRNLFKCLPWTNHNVINWNRFIYIKNFLKHCALYTSYFSEKAAATVSVNYAEAVQELSVYLHTVELKIALNRQRWPGLVFSGSQIMQWTNMQQCSCIKIPFQMETMPSFRTNSLPPGMSFSKEGGSKYFMMNAISLGLYPP